MKYSMRTKLTASFISTALICIILIGLFSNVQIEKHFREYVLQNHLKESKELVELISAKIKMDGSIDPKEVEDIGVFALRRGLILEVNNRNGDRLWDSFMTLDEEGQKNMQDIYSKLNGQQSEYKKQITKTSYPINSGSDVIGYVDITFFDAIYYNELDIHFIKTLNMVFLSVGVISLIMSFGVGIILSDRITRPIDNVIRKAQLIASGTYNERSEEKTGNVEISALTRSINDLAASLEMQENLRKRLTGDVAHELRTPLATLHSHIEAMIDGVWEPTVERLSSCDEEIKRIIRLVSDLEKLAHYESENLRLNKTRFEAKSFISQLFNAYEMDFEKNQVRYTIDCDDAFVYADKDKLSQVLINLISNALRFTPSGGSISISLSDRQGVTCIILSDTGQGIAENDLNHIFERFYRADVSRNSTTGGAGIGLSLVKAIINAHGGTIEVSSVLGNGTQFTIYIPSA